MAKKKRWEGMRFRLGECRGLLEVRIRCKKERTECEPTHCDACT